jgi:uncharacterized membrane protein YbhN (UPF0104 family)
MPSAPTAIRAQPVRAALPWLAAAIFVLAAAWIARSIERVGLAAIAEALDSVDAGAVARAVACSAGSYLVLTLFDWMAVRNVTRVRISYPSVALTAFTALSIGHVVGIAVLSSGALRYRLYSRFGLSAADVARVLIFCASTVAVGLVGLMLPAGLLWPDEVAEFARVSPGTVSALALLAAVLLVAYLACAWLVRGPIRVRGFSLPLPSARVALAQVGAGVLNYLLVAATLHQLLGEVVDVPLLAFASFYAAGHILAILSHVPGGFGVLELVVLMAAPGPEAMSALLLFRIIYFFVPFLAGSLLYCVFEFRQART